MERWSVVACPPILILFQTGGLGGGSRGVGQSLVWELTAR